MITILHNAACSTSRHAVERAGAAEIVDYMKTPLDREGLLELLAILEDEPAELVRKDAHFDSLGLRSADYVAPEAVADLLAEHPRLMQRPVLRRGDRAIIGRPKTRAEAFLAES